MPTLNLFTNIPVDAVTSSDILKDATKAVAKIIGKPESVNNSKNPLFLPFIREFINRLKHSIFSLFILLSSMENFIFLFKFIMLLLYAHKVFDEIPV